ncbi:MAG: exopolysaccharide biosynthesis polyprenyl glycosylphosphotransferase [Acidobacteriia bacterium]|nr:exopolysaccharide biosynthesis polyprenyl glycosylphosphotransferase [Terriglobia bacterium]
MPAPTSGFDWSGWQRRAATGRMERGQGRNVLIVGAGPTGRKLAAILQRDQIDGRTVVGFLDEIDMVGGDVLGRVEHLTRIARSEFVDEVILAIPDRRDLAKWVVREARRNRLNIRVIPDLYDCDCEQAQRREHEPGHMAFQYFGDVPVLTLHEEKAPTSGLFWKRVLDITFSAVALLLAAPLLATVAVLIKVASPGQVLYQAKRVGLKGRRFICYKFRTMVSDADQLKDGLGADNERYGPCFKIAADPRITRVGQFLRRYSLDELPQLWNVLRGEMSLVGPRPHPVDDFEHYRLEHLRCLDVTPGITGLWQVTARRDPSFQRNMALDLEYIEHWSLGMDLWILWKTMFVILHGSGA